MISMNWNEIVNYLKKCPVWARILAVAVAAALAAISLFSCSTIRVIGNEGSTTATVKQSALDSMEVNIRFSPLSNGSN